MSYWRRGGYRGVCRRGSGAVAVGPPPGPLTWSYVYGDEDPAGEVHLHQSIVIDRDITVDGMMVHQHEGQPAPTVSLDPDRSILVTSTGSIAVHAGATLQMRPSSSSVVHEIRFVGVDEQAFIGGGGVGGAPMDHTDYPDDIGLWVEGALDWAGHERCPWTRATATVAASATSCVVEDATGWKVGDTITICPTGDPDTDASHYLRYDERAILSITPGAGTTATVGFSAAAYAHPAVTFDGNLDAGPHTFTFGAEVLNLTRNVVVGGTDGGRSHIMVHPADGVVPITVDNVRLQWMGPQKLDGVGVPILGLGRYAFHFHFADDTRAGSTMRNVCAVDSGLHSFVTHATHDITWERAVAHRADATPYWWDILDSEGDLNPDSDRVTYDRCVASNVRWAHEDLSGRVSTGFVLNQGDDTAAVGCVAVGVQGTNLSSGFNWPEGTNFADHNVWDFRSNVAHNNQGCGVFTWQNDEHHHTLVDCQMWRNGNTGIRHGAYRNPYHFTDVTCWGNLLSQFELHAVSAGPGLDIGFTRCVFDSAGVAPYSFRTERHTLHAGGGVESTLTDCQFVGYTTAGFLANTDDATHPDVVHLVDPVFDGVEATWFWVASTVHEDNLVEVEFTGGDHFELRRDDWPSGTFVSDWNAMRVDL